MKHRLRALWIQIKNKIPTPLKSFYRKIIWQVTFKLRKLRTNIGLRLITPIISKRDGGAYDADVALDIRIGKEKWNEMIRSKDLVEYLTDPDENIRKVAEYLCMNDREVEVDFGKVSSDD